MSGGYPRKDRENFTQSEKVFYVVCVLLLLVGFLFRAQLKTMIHGPGDDFGYNLAMAAQSKKAQAFHPRL